MSSNRTLIRGIFLKFGLLSRSQIFTLLSKTLCRASIYENLNHLIKEGDIVPLKKSYQVGTPLVTHALKRMPSIPLYLNIRFNELTHRYQCNETLLELCKRSLVSGITTEHEMTHYNVVNPVLDRRPDGIIQVRRTDIGIVDLAIELERSVKGPKRVKEVLDCYQRTFEGNLSLNLGLLIHAIHPLAFLEYQTELAERPETFRKWVILSKEPDLSDVPETKVGKALSSPLENPWKPWTNFQIKSALIGTYGPYFDLQYTYMNSGHAG